VCHDPAVTEPEEAPAASPLAGAKPLVAIAVAAALVLAGGWWSSHPSRFRPVGNQVGAHASIGQPVLFSTDLVPSSEVTLRQAHARVLADTADATIRMVLCVDASSSAAVRESAKEHCDRVLPISGARLSPHLGSDRQVMVEVTLRRRGKVVLDGFDVTYRTGLRLGSESAGLVITVESN
jgi:hypothetical protein